MMPPPNRDSQRPPTADDSVLGVCRASVATLQRLLAFLYPEDLPPDILGVGEVLSRYPLTGLGVPATAAIEQSRRIIRARRDFALLGLMEFHAGLIYLYWGQCYAAAEQFAAARSQWTLAGETPSTCLSHYAQGVALQHGYHLEAAMSQFGLTTRCLNRRLMGPQASRLGPLIDELLSLVEEAQGAIRPDMWPPEAWSRQGRSGEAPPDPPPDDPHATDPGASDPAAGARPPEPEPAEAEPSRARTSGHPADRATHEATRPPRPDNGRPVPPPISNLMREAPAYAAGPVPGHNAADERFRWFVVHKRRDGLLPELTEGTWVLIDRDGRPTGEAVRELVVFGAPGPGVGSVVVKPRLTMAGGVTCYLGYLMPSPGGDGDLTTERPLQVDDSGQAVRVPGMILLGLVVGFWHNVIA